MKIALIATSAFLIATSTIAQATPALEIAQVKRTCNSFATQEEAQTYFVQTGQQSLDRDKDGIACESLPRSRQQQSQAKVLPTVVSTGDGDTLRVRVEQGQIVTVRLGCIDAPESTQTPWGPQAAAWLKQKLPVGQAVQMRVIDRDQYGRTVAELFLGNRSLNLWMVEEGQAVVYQQFLNGCPATRNQYLQAEAKARQNKLGFWNQRNPVMPWEYRRQRRTNR